MASFHALALPGKEARRNENIRIRSSQLGLYRYLLFRNHALPNRVGRLRDLRGDHRLEHHGLMASARVP